MNNIFCLVSNSLGTWPSMRLTSKKPPSLGLISSSLEDCEEVWEEELLGEGVEECSLSTSPLGFKIMFLFVGQFEAM